MARLDDTLKEADEALAQARRLREAVQKENPTVKEPPEEQEEETPPEASAEEPAPEPPPKVGHRADRCIYHARNGQFEVKKTDKYLGLFPTLIKAQQARDKFEAENASGRLGRPPRNGNTIKARAEQATEVVEKEAEVSEPEPAATVFEVGDVVTLRSGSGGMTVVALQPDDHYDLMFWVENDGRPATVRLPGACLERY
ncbi:MAG: hypothetical protein OXE50_14245 [Chloroflexi bacterium]|nr:hypothetical protein [Chloroflexota bacterium]